MRVFTKLLLGFLCFTYFNITSHGQTVTDPWATLYQGTAPFFLNGSRPRAIITDALGNQYTANSSTNTISKITATGTLTQTWATLASGAQPYGIICDAAGNLYTANAGNNTVSKITPDGTVTQAWANLASGASPYGVVIDGSGNLFTLNGGNNTISKITSSGTVTQAWATLANSPMASQNAITIDGSGNLYTANNNSKTISKISSSGTVTDAWATVSGANFNPQALVSDPSGNLYVCYSNVTSISKITSSGSLTQTWATLAVGAYAISMDNAGILYTGNTNNTISKITTAGIVTQSWAAVSDQPNAIAFDLSGNVFTANLNNSTVSKISANTWTGTTSNAWATSTNWDFGAVPINTDNVIIPSTGTKPTISVAGAVANKVTVQNGGVLTLTSPGTLTVTSGITVNPGGYLVGNSSNITGTVTLQQDVVAQRGWRVLANPFSTAQTIATVASNNLIPISTTANGGSGLTDSRTWSNAGNAWANVTGTTWAANTPYAVFIRGLSSDLSGGTGATYLGTGPTAFRYSVSGTLNGTSISVPQTNGNFVIAGNPYAAPVNTQALTGGVSKTYYTYQITATGNTIVKSGSWLPIGGSTSDNSSTIPVLGVVAYSATSNTSFNITPTDINTTPTPQTSLFGVESPPAQLELLVEQNGNYQDKLFVRLDAKSTSTGIDQSDLPKLNNDVVNVYTITPDDHRMAIDARNVFSTIPLGINAPIGNYDFKFANNTLATEVAIYLKDKFLKTQTEIKAGDSYNFSITADTASKGEQRFEITVESKAVINNVDPLVQGLAVEIMGNVTNTNIVSVKITGSKGPINIRATDMAGRNLSATQGAEGINQVQLGNISSGMLLLQFSDGKSKVTKKLIKF